jgi:hypothetical protein
VRINVEGLGKAVRWRMDIIARGIEDRNAATAMETPVAPQRMSLQRGPSMNGGRYRRRGWRASANFGSTWGQPPPSETLPVPAGGLTSRRQNSNSDYLQAPEQRWGKPRLDEGDDEEDDTSTPGQSLANNANGNATSHTANGTFASGLTVRGESLASYGDSQKTPLAEQRDGYGLRRPMRSESNSNEFTPVVRDRRV